MFYPSSKHHLDTMFVILCAIAGATSHNVSNTSRTSINQLNNHYRASFIDFILDPSLTELLQSSNTIDKRLAIQYSSEHQSTATKINRQSQTVCTLLSNLLNGHQMKFCLKHRDVLDAILPKVIQLTKRECIRTTSDLRWNCSAIDHLFNRSGPLAFTREAAFVRSVLNASMMYLVLQTCSDGRHKSCGCQRIEDQILDPIDTNTRTKRRADGFSQPEVEHSDISGVFETQTVNIDGQSFSQSDLLKLDSGTPLRLTTSMIRRQGCFANTAFANAFTKVFIDSEDTRALNKAYRILNEDHNYIRLSNMSSNVRRIVDSDNKDLAFIKWSKSSINLHNNNVGRQMVLSAIQRKCRCHGISGGCSFKTCWDHLLDFHTITSQLKVLYLTEITKVEVKNLGTYDKPDLYLTRHEQSTNNSSTEQAKTQHKSLAINDLETIFTEFQSNSSNSHTLQINRVKPSELLYLFDSPDYCKPQPDIGHTGTKGRACALKSNIITTRTSKKRLADAEMIYGYQYDESKQKSFTGAPGSCEQLCCNRGYHSELVLDMVTCKCRFKFCCEIECEHCLHQRMQHFCL